MSNYLKREEESISPFTNSTINNSQLRRHSSLKKKRPLSKAKLFIPDNKSRLWNYDPNSLLKSRHSSHPLLDKEIKKKKKKSKTLSSSHRSSLSIKKENDISLEILEELQQDRRELLKKIELPPRPHPINQNNISSISLSLRDRHIFEQFVYMLASHSDQLERELLIKSAWKNIEDIVLLQNHRTLQNLGSSTSLPSLNSLQIQNSNQNNTMLNNSFQNSLHNNSIYNNNSFSINSLNIPIQNPNSVSLWNSINSINDNSFSNNSISLQNSNEPVLLNSLDQRFEPPLPMEPTIPRSSFRGGSSQFIDAPIPPSPRRDRDTNSTRTYTFWNNEKSFYDNNFSTTR